MANIKRIKKEVKQITQDLVNECLTYQHFHPDVKPEKVNSVISDIIKKSNDIIYKINHIRSEKDVNPKKYYRDIIKEVNEKLIPVLDKLGGKN
jgi:hypothetical protein